MSINLIDDQIVKKLIDIIKDAGSEIMKVYDTDFNVRIKSDNSPVTIADTNANQIITKGLLSLPFLLPILSEEDAEISYDERSAWSGYWLIDPLDGTKEFIKRNDEFTVNIAFMFENKPVFGIVYAPFYDTIFLGGVNIKPLKLQGTKISKSISVRKNLDFPIQIAVSRSHPSKEIDNFINQFNKYNLHPMGSSLKICSVADGTVHLYPRLGPTMEWDTAASHAIVNAAGGELVQYETNEPLKYNKRNLLNPKFIAASLNVINSLIR